MSAFLLEPPPYAPEIATVAPAGREALGGIDWAGIAAEARGDIAMFEVAPGEGELQEWGRRGDLLHTV